MALSFHKTSALTSRGQSCNFYRRARAIRAVEVVTLIVSQLQMTMHQAFRSSDLMETAEKSNKSV